MLNSYLSARGELPEGLKRFRPYKPYKIPPDKSMLQYPQNPDEDRDRKDNDWEAYCDSL